MINIENGKNYVLAVIEQIIKLNSLPKQYTTSR